ncbi:MAG: OmpA family protein [Bacteroidales bacterium]|nr:OmpA family protein [Bacteroidales bacterium]
MKKINLILIAVFAFFTLQLSAQNKQADKVIEQAVKLVQTNQDEKATQLLINATEKYPDYAPLYVFLAEIYANNNESKKAVENYKKSVDLDPDYDINVYMQLGLLQKQNGEYKDARTNLSYFVSSPMKKRPQYTERCRKALEELDVIDSLVSNPVKFLPVNLGSNINDTADQYLPTLTLDEQLYITQRQDGKEDFYCSKAVKTDGNIPSWSKKVKLPYPLNSEQNEGAASISPDGQYLYFAKCNAEDGLGSCDIYRSKRSGNTWIKPENLGPNVNSASWDSQPSIASDGRTLFFASTREGGQGRSDIWFAYLKDDGTWTKAKNAGKQINTAGDEFSPFIHPSNTTLYFASDSLGGLGGMDIYYTKIENGRFTPPVNMGYPVNTYQDESCLVVSPDATYALYAKSTQENKTDIFAFELEENLRPTPVICMKGVIHYDDNKAGNEAAVEIKSLKTGRLVAATKSDKTDNTYLMTLPTGDDYAMSITCKGYMLHSENFSLSGGDGKTLKEKILYKDITLQALSEGKSVVLKNIFFNTNSSQLKAESTAELFTLVKLMNDNPDIIIEIAGYTDNVGGDEYNMQLSQQRSQSVKDWLAANGVDAGRIKAAGYGKANPVADNSTEQGRQLNRRTEFKILKKR